MKNMRWMYTGCLMIMTVALLTAQPKPVYEKEGNKVRVTHFYEDGTVRETGTYASNGKLHGDWFQYNEDGSVSYKAYYNNGKKEGKWFKWEDEGLTMYEIAYEDNKMKHVQKWKLEQKNMLAEN
ncbi:MAG: nicotinic acid mononucleotide adenyltransferase [Owenweeksia sp.]